MKLKTLIIAAAAAAVVACAPDGPTRSGLNPEDFIKEVDGKITSFHVLTNRNGMEVCLSNYGGRIISISVPDKNGIPRDVTLGFDTLDDYLEKPNKYGATIGRYANRIADGRFTLDGVEYHLPKHNFGHTLHGGPNGWDTKMFEAEQLDKRSVKMSIFSPDGDAGFPGNVHASVTFTLTDKNEIIIHNTATTDKPTVINMSHHSYFNLSGDGSKPVLDEIMYVNADYFTPSDARFMTTGEIAPVAGTPLDFRIPKPIGQDINSDHDQIVKGKGYAHNWVFNTGGDLNQVAASLYSPESGIFMEVLTEEPGVQIFSGNHFRGKQAGKKGVKYVHRASVCFETQHFPDSPNKPQFPSTVVRPGETYSSTTIYRFSTLK